jgi:cytoskeletal protein CcmA (bactofilin family)
MSQQSIVGQGTLIRGNVSGSGSLEIQGRIEGNVTMSGEVFIQPGALVKGNVTANQLSVAGSVAGNLTASEGLALEPGARVIGDLVASSIGIAEGALVRGLVRTADEAPLASAKAQPVPAVKAPAAQRPAMASFGRSAAAPATVTKPAAPAFPARHAPTPAPVPVAKPAPIAPVPAAVVTQPSPSILPVEPESDELEAVNEDQVAYDVEEAEAGSAGDSHAEIGSAESPSEAPERRDGPPPPVAPALKKSQKAKKKGR